MKRIVLSLLLAVMSLRAEEIYATFNVEARRHADLAFTTTGIVGKVYVDIASAVKKDAVLASLENSDASQGAGGAAAGTLRQNPSQSPL